MRRTVDDKFISDMTRMRSNYHCETCGKDYRQKPQGLHCSHFFGRANLSTRYHSENVLAQCYGCHAKFEGDPHAFVEYMRRRLGNDRYEALVKIAYQDREVLSKPTKQTLRRALKKQYVAAKYAEQRALLNNRELELSDFGWVPGEKKKKVRKNAASVESSESVSHESND